MLRLGLYGGSFDPIHHGHLIVARQALEDLSLDRVIFIPAAESPFKQNHSCAPAADRLAMVELAVQAEPAFLVDALEIHRGGPSYTIDTARAYHTRYSGDALFFLVGEDHIPALPRWNEFEELGRLVKFVILSRSDLPMKLEYPVVRRRLDLSSTEIRNRVANDLPISYLVPEKVLQYIQERKLYRGRRVSERMS
ncbi:MAG: nicotinate (nicotinamide) nucleotide adenylyltransferase [Verrucomicrobia bacterium]|nr:nicotinate (nicotinamide) nucleotide adenylyltransferase [Verrucomicrobiota bacterium]MBV9300277.1 nicotinate (nicotinamide) nucleotide adenylyltransferase [Verrucomicrobiota bacterium]